MTIASQTSRISYTGDGATTAFPAPFYFAANADLVVYLQDTLGNQTLQVLGTNYNLTGATLSAGGTCTFTAAPTTGYLVTIYRDPAVTQTTSYNNNDPFAAKSHELALDKLTTIAQRTKDSVSRSIRLTDGEAALTTALASVATRKNKLLGFDSNGALIYPLGPTFVNGTFTGVATIDSRATATVTTITGSTNIIRTAGYAVPGDGGGALYKRNAVQPAHLGRFQSADGAWWELSEPAPNLLMFGGDNTGVVDITPTLNAAYGYVTAGKATRVHAPKGVYSMKTQPNTITDPFTLFGDGVNGETTFTRDFNGTLNVGAFNVLCNGMQFRNFAFNAGAANVSGALIAFQSSASVGGNGFVLEDLDLATNATDAIHTCLLVDGSNKTAAASGDRDSRIRGVNVFGASDTSVLIKSGEGITWVGGGIFGAGGTGTYTGGIRIEGTVGVPSNYVRVNVSTVQGITTGISFGFANDCEVDTAVISGNIVRDATNSLRCITRGRATGTVPAPLNGCAHFPHNLHTWTAADPGKIDFPGSPIFMQFFTALAIGTGSTAVTFPTAFPSACLAVIPASVGSAVGTSNIAVVSFNTTTVNLSASTAGLNAIMIAIGY